MGGAPAWSPSGLVTLTTDFGGRDGYVGAMRGVLLAVAPALRQVDIAHDLPPQDLVHAAAALEAAAPWFPKGTVHLVVVDPGVGTDRAAVVVVAGGHCLVGPDNGVLVPVARRLADHGRVTAFRIASHPWLPPLRSATFHGRDVFAPTAGALAAGLLQPRASGPPHPRLLELPSCLVEWTDEGLVGEVVWADRFGNLVTGLGVAEVHAAGGDSCELVGRSPASPTLIPIRETYADVAPGEPVALVGSSGRLEIAVRDGSAAAQLAVGRGARVRIRGRPGGGHPGR